MLGGCSSPPARPLRGRRLPRRLIQLYAGLALYGVSMALIIRSTLGNMPWDVLHQGLAGRLGWSIGTVVDRGRRAGAAGLDPAAAAARASARSATSS